MILVYIVLIFFVIAFLLYLWLWKQIDVVEDYEIDEDDIKH